MLLRNIELKFQIYLTKLTFAGYQTVILQKRRGPQKRTPQTQPLNLIQLPGPAGPSDPGARIPEAGGEGGGPEPAFHPHASLDQRVSSASGQGDPEGHDACADEEEDADQGEVSDASG